MSDKIITSNIINMFQEKLLSKKNSLIELRKIFDDLYLQFFQNSNINHKKSTINNIPVTWFIPCKPSRNKVIIFLHGGGFTLGSTRGHQDFIVRIASSTCISVLSIDYSLAPESPFPTAINECICVYSELLNQYKPENIFFVGMTAGGTLVLSLVIKLLKLNMSPPRAVVCLSPPTDLNFKNESIDSNYGQDWVKKERLLTIQTSYLNNISPSDPIASPYYSDLFGFPPLLMQVGRNELLYDDSVLFYKKAKQYGVDATLQVWGNVFHAWHMFASVLNSGKEAINAIAQFIDLNSKEI